jgi:hypothetical protein
MSKITLFAQIIGKLDTLKFKKIVATHQNDKHQKDYSLLVMGCAQLQIISTILA